MMGGGGIPAAMGGMIPADLAVAAACAMGGGDIMGMLGGGGRRRH